MSAPFSIDDVNALDEPAFMAAFEHVYEGTPTLAAAVWTRRPFADRTALVEAFTAVADDLDDDGVLALLRAHPPLGGGGPMAAASVEEQQAAGLTTQDELLEQIRTSGERYQARFGFPFIIAVRGLGRPEIARALAERLVHDAEVERAEALRQVQRIARLRVEQVVS